jgi:hypothetical protein
MRSSKAPIHIKQPCQGIPPKPTALSVQLTKMIGRQKTSNLIRFLIYNNMIYLVQIGSLIEGIDFITELI